MEEDSGRIGLGADRAATADAAEPQSVSGKAGIPCADWLVRFVHESNRIEGIEKATQAHIDAHIAFLATPITIANIIEFVAINQPDARLRNQPQVPGVRVGDHVAPPNGPGIETNLRRILAMRDPWEQHIAYETLHPFTDGNGRSGRAIWLHRHYHERELDPWACQRGFLHSWYYHTLSHVRLAQGMETASADETAKLAQPEG